MESPPLVLLSAGGLLSFVGKMRGEMGMRPPWPPTWDIWCPHGPSLWITSCLWIKPLSWYKNPKSKTTPNQNILENISHGDHLFTFSPSYLLLHRFWFHRRRINGSLSWTPAALSALPAAQLHPHGKCLYSHREKSSSRLISSPVSWSPNPSRGRAGPASDREVHVLPHDHGRLHPGSRQTRRNPARHHPDRFFPFFFLMTLVFYPCLRTDISRDPDFMCAFTPSGIRFIWRDQCVMSRLSLVPFPARINNCIVQAEDVYMFVVQ